ncbi:hypothetical protein QAD02_022242 [Eretmocerus hayati]|uniref:Uncharacterized protein n=1 Tax=Eretmocerus hayati TaxID=131215 RepID=A0ACC2PTJ3_9HYME|nr:hypothetical protein QAD02_022242 [Eretmocerus hayati]
MVEGKHEHRTLSTSMRKSMLDVAYWLNNGTLSVDEIHSDSGCSLEDEEEDVGIGKGGNGENERLLEPKNRVIENLGMVSPRIHIKINQKADGGSGNHIKAFQTSSEDTAEYILANNHVTRKTDALMIVEGSKVMDHCEDFPAHLLKNSCMSKSMGSDHCVTPVSKRGAPRKVDVTRKTPKCKGESELQNQEKILPGASNNLIQNPENGSDESIFKSRFLIENSPLCRISSEVRKKKLFQSKGSPIEFSPASEVDSQSIRINQTSKNLGHPALTSPATHLKTPFSLRRRRRSSLTRKRDYSAGTSKLFSDFTQKMCKSKLFRIHEQVEFHNSMKDSTNDLPDLKKPRVGIDHLPSDNLENETISKQIESSQNRDSVIVKKSELKSTTTSSSKILENSSRLRESKDLLSVREEGPVALGNNDTIAPPKKLLHYIKYSCDQTAKICPEQSPVKNEKNDAGDLNITFDKSVQDQNLENSQANQKKRNCSRFILISSSDESEPIEPIKSRNVRRFVDHKNIQHEPISDEKNTNGKKFSKSKRVVQSSKLIDSSSDETGPLLASCGQEPHNHPTKRASICRSTLHKKIIPSNDCLDSDTYRRPLRLNNELSSKLGKNLLMKKFENFVDSSSDEEIFTPSLAKTSGEIEGHILDRSEKAKAERSVKVEKTLKVQKILHVRDTTSQNHDTSDEDNIYTPSFRISLRFGEKSV